MERKPNLHRGNDMAINSRSCSGMRPVKARCTRVLATAATPKSAAMVLAAGHYSDTRELRGFPRKPEGCILEPWYHSKVRYFISHTHDYTITGREVKCLGVAYVQPKAWTIQKPPATAVKTRVQATEVLRRTCPHGRTSAMRRRNHCGAVGSGTALSWNTKKQKRARR